MELTTIPPWVKPGCWGVVVGAIAAMVIGFTWGGWVTGGTVKKLIAEGQDEAVVSVMTPVCVERWQHDPQVADNVAELNKLESYQRDTFIREKGQWASTAPYKFADSYRGSALYRGCAEKIRTAKTVEH